MCSIDDVVKAQPVARGECLVPIHLADFGIDESGCAGVGAADEIRLATPVAICSNSMSVSRESMSSSGAVGSAQA